jgi:hypothetical protein
MHGGSSGYYKLNFCGSLEVGNFQVVSPPDVGIGHGFGSAT